MSSAMSLPKRVRKRRKFRNWKIFGVKPNIKAKNKNEHRYYALSVPLRCVVRKFNDKERRRKKLQPARRLFDKIFKDAKDACKNYDGTKNIFEILNTVLPDECFGSKHHRKIFYKTVKLIMSRAVHECVLRSTLIKGYEFKKIPWLKNFNGSRKIWTTYLYYGIIWMLDGIVKPLIRFNYYCMKAGYAHEIQYVPKHLWNPFQHQIIHKLIKLKYVTPVDRSQHIGQIRGVMQFIPKNGLKNIDNFRPLLRLHVRRSSNFTNCTRSIFYQARLLSGNITGSFYSKWTKYLRAVEGRQIYGVKLDITDAYGNINTELLAQIIQNVQSYNDDDKSFLIQHIRSQYCVFKYQIANKMQIYKWNHGLIQGDTLSGALCELYMSYIDNIKISELHKENCFIHRTVDDYLFCSTEPEDVKKFITIIQEEHTINPTKTEGNIIDLNNNLISYCGRTINLDNGEISANIHFYPRKSIHYKFKIWNINFPVLQEEFLLRSLQYGYNNYHFQKMLLNVEINSDETILQNIFRGMLVLAFKFDVTVMSIYDKNDYRLYGEILEKTIWKYCRKCVETIRSTENDKKSKITFGMVLKVAYAASRLVLSRRNTRYTQILQHIKEAQKNVFVNKAIFDLRQFRAFPKEFSGISMTRRVNICIE